MPLASLIMEFCSSFDFSWAFYFGSLLSEAIFSLLHLVPSKNPCYPNLETISRNLFWECSEKISISVLVLRSFRRQIGCSKFLFVWFMTGRRILIQNICFWKNKFSPVQVEIIASSVFKNDRISNNILRYIRSLNVFTFPITAYQALLTT